MPARPLDEPLVFTPYFRPQIWGGRNLAELLHKPLPDGVAVGESWELSAQPLHVSRVREGPWAGVSLQQLWDEHRGELIGPAAPPLQFPWLVKWLDCHELLSVQVHPDDDAAGRMLSEPFGKTESWVVIHAEPTARIYAGLNAGVTAAELDRRSRDGSVAECLHSFTPRAGDCLHIPAGTVHAVGGGVVIAEVQQTSDATFRLFDWNRVDAQGKSRELHLDQALAVIDFTRGPVHPVASRATNGPEPLVSCPYYDLTRFTLTTAWSAAIDRLTVALVLDGEVDLRAPQSGREDRRRLRKGETVLIPASVQEVLWERPASSAPPVLLIVRQPLS